jgi:hypothetical protein
MYQYCYNLTSTHPFNTSNVTTARRMYYNCVSLTSIPYIDTSKMENMYYTYANCSNVKSGALSMYQQASTQTNPPTNHQGTFNNCGSNTTEGAAELAQIPSDWK